MKVSKIKRNNQKYKKFSKKGKVSKNVNDHFLKKQRKKAQLKIYNGSPASKNIPEEEEEEIDVTDMLDPEYLEESITNKENVEDLQLEQKYEQNILQHVGKVNNSKEVRYLLPVKTPDGYLEKRILHEENSNENEEEKTEECDMGIQEMEVDIQQSVSVAKLLASRQEMLESHKFKIGNLCNIILMNPEQHMKNFIPLLEFMSDKTPGICITIRKLAMASLLEVFKDVLPNYRILQVKPDGVKLKKETLQLQNYETALLRHYKQYLQKLEKLARNLQKKYQINDKKKQELDTELGTLAVTCMCELLVTHPYFNFSNNISNFLVPLLDNKHKNIRQIVYNNISKIFKEDKRAELSLMIIRRLNQYIKQRKQCVHSEVLGVLLSLRIKDIDLDKEKEDETKQKKLMSHKRRILALSKRERKRDKKLQEVEKEMLETKAEENKQTKQKLYTEITSIVFTIYFRILKQTPNTKVLSVCLAGLAKFAHCINLEFYQDLVNVLNSLLEQGNLGLMERLNCISTVFTILSGQAATLNIDPQSFYNHLYKNLYNIHAGKNNEEISVLLNILGLALISRHKSVAQNKLVSFIKRLATMTLYLQHHGALGILGVIKTMMQFRKSTHVLLDTDNDVGDGVYLAELDEPDYCNAHCSALWETVALQRHYHSVVQNIAKNISWEVPTNGEGSIPLEFSKLQPMDLFTEFDPSNVSFKPAIPPPKKVSPKLHSSNYEFRHPKLAEFVRPVWENYCSNYESY